MEEVLSFSLYSVPGVAESSSQQAFYLDLINMIFLHGSAYGQQRMQVHVHAPTYMDPQSF